MIPARPQLHGPVHRCPPRGCYTRAGINNPQLPRGLKGTLLGPRQRHNTDTYHSAQIARRAKTSRSNCSL
eukprot:9412408-Lingulodinium_polyedra.AAC.1